jgi:hypothetical protein
MLLYDLHQSTQGLVLSGGQISNLIVTRNGGRLSTWAGGRRFRGLIKHELTAFSAVGCVHLGLDKCEVCQSVCLNHTTMSFRHIIIVLKG